MKRWISLILAAWLLCPCIVWAEEDLPERYDAAAALMVAGDYAGAAESFGALTGYADAPQMAIYCRGMALLAEGDYARAAKAFSHLGTFKDAPVLMIACQGAAMEAEAAQLLCGGVAELLEAPEVFREAAGCFAQIDYLPEMAARAEACEAAALAAEASVDVRRFDGVGMAADGVCAVQRGDLWGAVDTQGRLIVPCEWDAVRIEDGVVKVQRGTLWGAFDLTGRMMLPCEWDNFLQVGNVWLVGRAKLMGVMSLMGEEIIACQWEKEYLYEEGQLILSRSAEGRSVTQVVLTEQGLALPENVIVKGWVTEDLLLVRRDWQDTYLYRLSTGEMTAVSGEVCPFGDGYYIVEDYDEQLFTLYAADGTELTPLQGLLPVTASGLWGAEAEDGCWKLTDRQGRVLLSGTDSDGIYVDDFADGFTSVEYTEDGVRHAVLLDAAGNIVLEADEIEGMYNGRFVDRVTAGQRGVIDLTTGVITPVPEEASWSFTQRGEGLFSAWCDGKYVMVDAIGGWCSDAVYDSISGKDPYLEDGELLAVCRDGLFGLVDARGREVVPCQYQSVSARGVYYCCVMRTEKGRQWDVFGAEGLVWSGNLAPAFFHTLHARSDDLLYNAQGEAVFDPMNVDEWSSGGGYIFSLQDGLLTICDDAGQVVH